MVFVDHCSCLMLKTSLQSMFIIIFLGINHTTITHVHTSILLFLIHHRGVHWVLVQYAQMDFVLQYLKLIQFLVMCHFYWTLATRALRRERLTNWWVSFSLSLWFVTVLLSFLFFSHWQIISMYTVHRVIFAPCNFNPLTLAKCFVPS